MRLRCLAGAYAGQFREYGVIAGLAALKAGTAARDGDTGPVAAPVAAVAAVPVTPAAPPTDARRPPGRRSR